MHHVAPSAHCCGHTSGSLDQGHRFRPRPAWAAEVTGRFLDRNSSLGNNPALVPKQGRTSPKWPASKISAQQMPAQVTLPVARMSCLWIDCLELSQQCHLPSIPAGGPLAHPPQASQSSLPSRALPRPAGPTVQAACPAGGPQAAGGLPERSQERRECAREANELTDEAEDAALAFDQHGLVTDPEEVVIRDQRRVFLHQLQWEEAVVDLLLGVQQGGVHEPEGGFLLQS